MALSKEEVKRRDAESKRRWRENNPEKMEDARKKWKDDHPEYERQYYLDRRTEKLEYQWAWRIKKEYGVTPEWYYAQLKAQGGRCGICGAADPGRRGKKRWDIDHDHRTGKARGLLCSTCNSLLGHARDRIEVLRRAETWVVNGGFIPSCPTPPPPI